MADEKKKGCDCGCEHEHGTDCDCGCDMDEGVIVLQDEDGKDIPFYHIATLDHGDKEYACLQQADDEEPCIEIFELQEVEDGGDSYYNLLPIDDELYEVLFKQLQDEVAEYDDDCCDPDCDCHHNDDEEE